MDDVHKPIYFKGLNGVRAIAAMVVLVCHIDQFSRLFNVEKIGFHEHGMAGYAVDMFFVLSGYLITYLLLAEKEKTKTISLKKFYLRRIFRIWPIYYLAIVIAVVLIYFNLGTGPRNWIFSLGLYTFFSANVAYVMDLSISSIVPLWSVGVEEQFYLLWPHLVKKTPHYFLAFVSFYLLFVILKLAMYTIFSPESAAYFFMAYSSLNIMCMGAIGALIVYFKHPVLSVLYRKEIQIIAWGVLIYSCIYKPLHLFTFIDQELNSLFYLIIIVNVSTNKDSLISLENKVMNYLGRISYGIYVYHMLVLFTLPSLLSYLGVELNYFSMFGFVTMTTLLTATVSYHYFEMPFLKKKSTFSIVRSTNSGSSVSSL